VTDPDAAEITDWSGTERGKFYRPVKQEPQTKTEGNDMNIAEEIHNEVIDLPVVLQTEVLDFIQRLKQERGTAKRIGNSLDEFIGGWSEQEEQEFNATIAAMQEIDEKFWQ